MSQSKSTDDPKLPNVLKLQSILRAFLAVRVAEKRIKRHILRTKIANELLETEANYLRDLRTIHWEFHLGSGEVLSVEEEKILFMNIGEIVDLHTELRKELQEKVRKQWSYHQTVGDTIDRYVKKFGIYEKYITNYKEAADFLKRSRGQAKIDKYLQSRETKDYCRGLPLESLLVMPVQRLPRYLLLLKELRKYTDQDHPDYPLINNAMQNLDELAKQFNEVQRDKETQRKVSEIFNNVHGVEDMNLDAPFIKEGPISVKKIKVVKPTLRRSLSIAKNLSTQEVWQDLYIYLFKDTMLCAKRIGPASAKTLLGICLKGGKGFYKFSKSKAHALSATTRLVISADDPCTFKLVNESEVSEFRTSSPHDRDMWVTAFSSTLVWKHTKQ
jgi:hypothetical protein